MALHRLLLRRLQGADSSTGAEPHWIASLSQRKGGSATGPNSTDRGKLGTKRHIGVEVDGTPLGLTISGANRNDAKMLEPTLDAVPPMRGRRGRPCRRPYKLHAYKGYDHRFLPPCLPHWRHHPAHCSAWHEDSTRRGRHRWKSSAPLPSPTLAALICIKQIAKFVRRS
jgi:hypothetical protein